MREIDVVISNTRNEITVVNNGKDNVFKFNNKLFQVAKEIVYQIDKTTNLNKLSKQLNSIK